MSNANYFKVDDLPVEYPIFVEYNGKKWNFLRDYQKKLNELDSKKSTNHKLFDLAIELGVFDHHKIYKNIPFLVTNDIRVEGDKKKYYIVDYLIPDKNQAVILTTNKNKNRLGKVRQTLTALKIDIIEINELEIKSSVEMVNYLKGLNTTLEFIGEESMNFPNYFIE